VLTPLLGQLAGRQATMIYDADGRIRQLDTAGPSNIVLDDSLKVLVGSVFGINGTLTLAVGESVTRPVDAAVPLIEYRDSRWTGDMRFTLNGISQEGAARIAHMTTALSGGLTLVTTRHAPRDASTEGRWHTRRRPQTRRDHGRRTARDAGWVARVRALRRAAARARHDEDVADDEVGGRGQEWQAISRFLGYAS